jgi:hypothetical protein
MMFSGPKWKIGDWILYIRNNASLIMREVTSRFDAIKIKLLIHYEFSFKGTLACSSWTRSFCELVSRTSTK